MSVNVKNIYSKSHIIFIGKVIVFSLTFGEYVKNAKIRIKRVSSIFNLFLLLQPSIIQHNWI